MDKYEQEQADKWIMQKQWLMDFLEKENDMLSFQPGSILEFKYNGTRRIVVVVDDPQSSPGTFLTWEIEKDYTLHDEVIVKRFKYANIGKEDSLS